MRDPGSFNTYASIVMAIKRSEADDPRAEAVETDGSHGKLDAEKVESPSYLAANGFVDGSKGAPLLHVKSGIPEAPALLLSVLPSAGGACASRPEASIETPTDHPPEPIGQFNDSVRRSKPDEQARRASAAVTCLHRPPHTRAFRARACANPLPA